MTVVGVMLASTDLKKLLAGTHGIPAGLPWAIVSAVMFGIGGFILGWASKEAGAIPALWGSRTAQVICFGALAALRPHELRQVGRNVGTAVAVATGIVDLVGVLALVFGAAAGFLSIVLAASAIFPLIAVALSVAFLHERPVPNQYRGRRRGGLGPDAARVGELALDLLGRRRPRALLHVPVELDRLGRRAACCPGSGRRPSRPIIITGA